MIRNFIDVIGITPENKLPTKINGQIAQYSENETIFITEGRHKIKNIFQIKIDIKITSKLVIDAPLGKVVVLDGIKRFRIKSNEKDNSKRENIIEVETPFNSFFELPKGINKYKDVEVYIMDAYFQLIDSNKIYSHMIYLINTIYPDTKNSSDSSDTIKEHNNLIDHNNEVINYTIKLEK